MAAQVRLYQTGLRTPSPGAASTAAVRVYQAGLRIPGAAQQVRLYQVGLSALASTTAAVRLYNAGLNLASPSAWPLYGRKGGAWVTFQEYRRVAGVWTRIV